VLTGSDPRDGSVLKAAPKQITTTCVVSVSLGVNDRRVGGAGGAPGALTHVRLDPARPRTGRPSYDQEPSHQESHP
ncbi:hypothetical protein ACFW88_13220, partial [Streptomyces anandii]